MPKPVLQIVIGSTRPGRVGRPVAEWFQEKAVEHGDFEVELVDLAAVALPFLDEPELPRFGRYQHQHTRDWSATVSRADAFVFVTPEYNHGPSAALKNAIDFLHAEWQYKPLGFVSYGGIAAGARAVQILKQFVLPLKMTPLFETVAIPLVEQFLDEKRQFRSNEILDAAASMMLTELHRLSEALRPLRRPAR
ncbi:NAD(P)H-dependent oxidoreductase [Blastococcus sp. CT_GayMR16]|uniref:NADPH-dependent FMN reductase n=1 Tax=Blastococcus sp. CT_GayMR16 TaxID=2559607 RepID=UPI001073854F|nr:NAD(P)H-dependent oxidoreductase [Blastococcus sp. CT_GayMR16]TFV91447.1 NADPH-dependent oxidoreductase [Blastococcus sp. CT_GayMR16]